MGGTDLKQPSLESHPGRRMLELKLANNEGGAVIGAWKRADQCRISQIRTFLEPGSAPICGSALTRKGAEGTEKIRADGVGGGDGGRGWGWGWGRGRKSMTRAGHGGP